MENYFDFFELEKNFIIDESQLRKIFLINSKKFHPDFFVDKSINEQNEALKKTSLNNEAYHILKDFFSRFQYILKFEKIIHEDDKYSLSPTFLMEMMEINEQISELNENKEFNKIEIEQQIKNSIQNIENNIIRICSNIHFPIEEIIAEQLKKLYFERKYMLRIQERLNTFAH